MGFYWNSSILILLSICVFNSCMAYHTPGMVRYIKIWNELNGKPLDEVVEALNADQDIRANMQIRKRDEPVMLETIRILINDKNLTIQAPIYDYKIMDPSLVNSLIGQPVWGAVDIIEDKVRPPPSIYIRKHHDIFAYRVDNRDEYILIDIDPNDRMFTYPIYFGCSYKSTLTCDVV